LSPPNGFGGIRHSASLAKKKDVPALLFLALGRSTDLILEPHFPTTQTFAKLGRRFSAVYCGLHTFELLF